MTLGCKRIGLIGRTGLRPHHAAAQKRRKADMGHIPVNRLYIVSFGTACFSSKYIVSYLYRNKSPKEVTACLLECEGVGFDSRGHVDMKRYGWNPQEASFL